MRVEIAPQIEAVLEERRIGLDEVRKVIEFAEDTKNLFTNRVSGHYLASLIVGAATYWIEYGREADWFTIYGAYTHRMKILEGFNPSPELNRPGTDWSCLKCDKLLEWAMVKLTYLNQTFETGTLACFSCQRVFISEEIAVGKMAMVEMLLEDK